MDIFLHNIPWMVYNLYLSVLPVIFCWFLFRMPNKFFVFIVGFLWFLYLPNTIYVVTDVHHLIEHWYRLRGIELPLVVLEYGLLVVVGLICFLVAFYPFEIILLKYKFNKTKTVVALIALNFLMGFALVLGKFERVNSWDVFINPLYVLTSSLDVLLSLDVVALGILFGLFSNFFYFLFRDAARKLYTQWTSSP